MDQVIWQCGAGSSRCVTENITVIASRRVDVGTGLALAAVVPLIVGTLMAFSARDAKREYRPVLRTARREAYLDQEEQDKRRCVRRPLEVRGFWEHNTRAAGLTTRHLCAFHRHYPGYAPAESIRALVDDGPDRHPLLAWINVHRLTDALSGPLFQGREGGRAKDVEWKDGTNPMSDPATTGPRRTPAQPVFWPLERHSGYRRSPRLLPLRGELLSLLREEQTTAGPAPDPTPDPTPGPTLDLPGPTPDPTPGPTPDPSLPAPRGPAATTDPARTYSAGTGPSGTGSAGTGPAGTGPAGV